MMATLVSLVVLLGLQFLRLSELIVRFDVELSLIAKMVMGLGTSFLPLGSSHFVSFRLSFNLWPLVGGQGICGFFEHRGGS